MPQPDPPLLDYTSLPPAPSAPPTGEPRPPLIRPWPLWVYLAIGAGCLFLDWLVTRIR